VDRECKNGVIMFEGGGEVGAAPSEFVAFAPKLLLGTCFVIISPKGDEAESISSSGRASMLISPLVYWSACFAVKWVSSADFTLNKAGQKGQRLFIA
jgi:hypothetical protein